MGMIYREKVVALSNFAANGSVGTALATVDVASRLTFAQTTASVTVNLPTPTASSLSKVLTIQNLSTSTQILQVTGAAAGSDIINLIVGDVRDMAWNGSSWRVVAPLRSLVLTTAVPSGLLGGVTWSVTGTNPLLLGTSAAMSGMIIAEVQQQAGAFDYWVTYTTGASGLLMRGQVWSSVVSGSLGIVNASYSNSIEGFLVGNSRTFRLLGETHGAGFVLTIDQMS